MHRSNSILLFAMCLLFGSHSITLADEKQSEHEKTARAFIAELQAGRFEAATDRFDAKMKAVAPKDKLASIWQDLQAQAGAFKETQTARTGQAGQYQTVDVNCRFESSKLALRVVFDSKGKIAGFTAQPEFETTDDRGEAVVLKTPTGEIHGTVDVPKGLGPFPIVVFIAGSGPTDRNGNQMLMKNDSLRKLGYALVAKGYATLRYDKRGIADSRNAGKGEANLSFDDFVSDTVGWIEILRKDKRFSTVSVLGHSQGSLVGAIACRKAKVSSFISIAGAGKPIQQVLRDQLGPKLAGELKTQAFEIIDQLAKGQTVSTIPKELQTIFRPSVQQFISSWMKYDPVKEVAELKVPALIVNGTTDIQIGVEDAKLLADANKLARLAVIKDMNHVLTICKTPEEQLKTYTDPKRPITPELVQELSSFLNEFSGD